MAIKYILWHYTPSLPAAIAFTAMFGVLTAVHFFFAIKKRARFCIPFVIGGAFEGVGYAFRAVAHYNTNRTLPYAIQSLLILLGPILFAASIYMTLSRIILTMNGEHHSPIRTKWLTKMFVGGDILCFLIQAGGGSFISNAKKQSDVNLGEDIILGGLVLQIVVFGLFITVAGIYHLRARRAQSSTAIHSDMPWERHLFILYMVSVMITARNIFRVIEYGMGSNGYPLEHEWTLFVFDGAQMVLVLAVSIVWYGANLVSRKSAVEDVEKPSIREVK